MGQSLAKCFSELVKRFSYTNQACQKGQDDGDDLKSTIIGEDPLQRLC